MSVTVDTQGLQLAQAMLKKIPTNSDKAMARALNRAIIAARTAASKGIRENYIIKASTIKKHMKLKKASYTSLTAELNAKGSPMDLMMFKVKVKKKGTIFATVKRGGGGALPRSFFVTTGRPGIYHREKKDRLPIKREYGPSVPQMMGNVNVTKMMEERTKEVYARTFEHEIHRMLEG